METLWIEIICNGNPAYEGVCLAPGQARFSDYDYDSAEGGKTSVRVTSYLTKDGRDVHQRIVKAHDSADNLTQTTRTRERWCPVDELQSVPNGECPKMPAWRDVVPFSLRMSACPLTD